MKRRRRNIWVIGLLFCLIVNIDYGQNNKLKIDSLNKLINVAPEDSNKVNLYCQLARMYNLYKSKENDINNIKALDIAKKIGFTSGINRQYILLKKNYFYRGIYDEAMAYHLAHEKFLKENNMNDELLTSYNMYGNLLVRQKKFKEASKYYHLARQFHLEKNNSMQYAYVLNNIVLLNMELNQNDSALFYSYRAIEIFRKNNENSWIANSVLGVAEILEKKGNLKEAEKRANESLDIYKSINEKHGICNCLVVLGKIARQMNRLDTALVLTKAALKIAEDLNIAELKRSCYLNVSEISKALNNYRDAYDYFLLYKQISDTLSIDNMQGKMLEMEVKYEVSKMNGELTLEKRQTSYLMLGIFLIAVMFAVSLYAFIQKRKSSLIIAEQKKLVEVKQKEVLDSIHYAKRIQNTLIANREFISKNIPNNFILFHPKDIVSGDFYWATQNGSRFYLAVCDSTGHGVPGAFMSLLNITFLNEAINEKKIESPNEIFNYVRKKLVDNLGKEGQKDGFDGVLVCIDSSNSKITYAAANNAPVLISNNIIYKLDADRMPVGVGEKNESFTLHEIKYKTGDNLYLYTDGFADQFGGKSNIERDSGGKKYKYKRLNNFILANNQHTMETIQQQLTTEFISWKGDLEQTDDVTIIGISI